MRLTSGYDDVAVRLYEWMYRVFFGGEIHFVVGKGGITAHRGIKMRKEWGRIFKSADTNSVY